MLSEKIGAELKEAANVLQEFLSNKNNIKQIEDAARAISNAFKNGKKLITCGNGGSMCDAMHFAEELSGRFREHRASFPAMAISDPSFLSCSGNDYGYEKVFSRFISGIGQQGDVLAAISTSGNSANIIEAVKMAREKGMTVVGFTGKTGGELSALCDIEIRSPHTPYADRAQEIHIKAIHIIILLVEELMENKG